MLLSCYTYLVCSRRSLAPTHYPLCINELLLYGALIHSVDPKLHCCYCYTHFLARVAAACCTSLSASIFPTSVFFPLKIKGNGQKRVYPPLFQTKVRGGKMQTSSPPVITSNRSQSNPDDMITLPRPIQSVGMDLHDVSGTSTGQTLPRERRAPPGTHFCPTIWWVYPHIATIFILHPLLSTFSSTFVRNIKQQLQGVTESPA